MAGIVGLATALRIAVGERDDRNRRVAALGERLSSALRDRLLTVEQNGATAPRVPGILSLQFPGLMGETLLMKLDLRGIAVSLGSACSSGSIEPSHVLRAMGLTLEENYSSLRVSLSSMNGNDDVDRFVDAMADIDSARR